MTGHKAKPCLAHTPSGPLAHVRSCGVPLTCCAFLGPSRATTEAEPVVHVCARVWAVGGRDLVCRGGVPPPPLV